MPKYLLKNKHTSCITVCLIITANSVSKKVTRIQHRLNCYVFSQWRRKQCTWKCISFRYNQVRDSSQHYLNDFEDNPSRDNEEISSFYLGTLESSKNSGLSSSSYELSQYMNGAEHSDAAPQPYGGEHAVPLTSTSSLLMPLIFKALYFLRPSTCASDVSSSEVLYPSCCYQFWACGSTDSGHYRLVSTGECQPPGNPQSGGRFSQVV